MKFIVSDTGGVVTKNQTRSKKNLAKWINFSQLRKSLEKSNIFSTSDHKQKRAIKRLHSGLKYPSQIQFLEIRPIRRIIEEWLFYYFAPVIFFESGRKSIDFIEFLSIFCLYCCILHLLCGIKHLNSFARRSTINKDRLNVNAQCSVNIEIFEFVLILAHTIKILLRFENHLWNSIHVLSQFLKS